MNYRHAYHAGNFADVVKHLALSAILLHLKKKDKPFAVIDSHAGCGHYDLSASEAARTGEAEDGIKKLSPIAPGDDALGTYLRLARDVAGHYPGSPLITAKLLRSQDRLIAIEKHPEDFAVLRDVLSPWRNASAECADGYVRLNALVPPFERRGLVLIDPPYEAEDEFQTAARGFAQAYRKFATGIYLIWFPVKSDAAAAAFAGEILASGASKVLRIDIALDDAPQSAREKLNRAGLIVVNPPYGFDAQMRGALAKIAPLLGRAHSAQTDVTWLAGEGR